MTAPVILLVASTALGLLASPRICRIEWYEPAATTMYRDYNELHVRFADYLRRRTEASTTIGVHYAGVVPYFSERFAIDMLQ